MIYSEFLPSSVHFSQETEQMGYSIYPFQICYCSGFVLKNIVGTALHSLFNIIEKARKIQYLTQRRAAKIQYVRTKFERTRKRQYITQHLPCIIDGKIQNKNKFVMDLIITTKGPNHLLGDFGIKG